VGTRRGCPASRWIALGGASLSSDVRPSHVMPKHLFIGGLVAADFDSTGAYLLTVSHSGRGVFSTDSWERVAR
jgi:hypothetical protein